MTLRSSPLPLTLALSLTCLLASACGSDAAEPSAPDRDAATDVAEPDTGTGEDVVVEAAPPDAEPDIAVEAGSTNCAEPCSVACAEHTAIEGECAGCMDTVCAEHTQRAESAPNRDLLFECIDACGTQPGCADDCCSKYSVACAYEGAYEYCTCGFPKDDCTASCTDTCTTTGLTQACGVCASQSPCALTVFDYLFAKSRYGHQDCVETCTTSALTLEECMTRCRDDYPEAGTAYEAFIGCACGS